VPCLIRLVTLALLGLPSVACSQGVGRVGRVPVTVQVGDIVYSARVRVVADSAVADPGAPPSQRVERVQAAVTVTNMGRKPVELGRWPNCFFTTLELWPATAAPQAPAWDEERWRAAYQRTSGVIVECDFAGRPESELAPGASITVEREASSPLVRDILGDSLAADQYRAALRIRPHTAPRDAPPTIRLDAGKVVLVLQPSGGRAPPR
jgi:hypothetical protein